MLLSIVTTCTDVFCNSVRISPAFSSVQSAVLQQLFPLQGQSEVFPLLLQISAKFDLEVFTDMVDKTFPSQLCFSLYCLVYTLWVCHFLHSFPLNCFSCNTHMILRLIMLCHTVPAA